MNANVGINGLTALRRVDPDNAAFACALAALLDQASLAVNIVAADDASPWFAAGEGLHFHIATLKGGAIALAPDRVSDAVTALDAVDPMLVAVEGALGVSMDADAMTDGVATDTVIVSLWSGDDRLLLAVPRDHERRAAWIERAAALPPRGATMPCLVRIEAAGPRLTVAEAGDLGDGDLLLIPNRTAVTLCAAHIASIGGTIDLTTGAFIAGQTGAAMPDQIPDFLVPLTIRLPDRMTSAASLASLVPGTTLPLGPLTEGMPVELRVADRLLAQGELVQLGDRFAVLIESRKDIADPVTGESD
jgi:Type III flagellar switch regulator (C-ring) FliN C-term